MHAALDIATSAIPFGGGAKIAGKALEVGAKKLTPYVGKKISNSIVKNTAIGATTGVFHGAFYRFYTIGLGNSIKKT